MARKRKKKPSKLVNGKVVVKGYTRSPGKLPTRNEKGRFKGSGKGKGKGKGSGQTSLF